MKENFNPFYSVLIPAFNGEKTLSATLESILDQTYTNFEIIICDDASTDNTMQVIEEYERKDARIRHIAHSQNLSAFIARNNLIREAKGDFITFVDADDTICDRNIFEYIFKLLQNESYDIITLPFKTTQKSKFLTPIKTYSVLKDNVFSQYVNQFFTIFPWSRFYKRELLLKSMLTDRICYACDDYLLVIPAFYHAKKTLFLPEPVMYLYKYGLGGWGGKNYTLEKFKRMHSGAVEVYYMIGDWILKNRIGAHEAEVIRVLLQKTFLCLFELSNSCQDKVSARDYFFSSVPKEELKYVFGGKYYCHIVTEDSSFVDLMTCLKRYTAINVTKLLNRVKNSFKSMPLSWKESLS